MIYCQNSRRKVKVRWNFPDRDSPQLLTVRSPVNVDISNVPNPDEEQVEELYAGNTTALIQGDYYAGILADNLPENYAYYLKDFTAIGASGVAISTPSNAIKVNYFSPPNDRKYHLNSRLFIRNKDQFQLYRKDLAAYVRLIWDIYRIRTNLWQISISHPDGYLAFTGASKPTYSVDCGDGCPPGTIDCGGCCSDCGEITNKLRAINGKL